MFRRFLPRPAETTLLLGPRATGKSTWIEQNFPRAPSYDLLRSSEALRLARDPSVLTHELSSLAPGSWVVIDEVQKVPALLDEVHHLIERRKLRFLLSGSSANSPKSGSRWGQRPYFEEFAQSKRLQVPDIAFGVPSVYQLARAGARDAVWWDHIGGIVLV